MSAVIVYLQVQCAGNAAAVAARRRFFDEQVAPLIAEWCRAHALGVVVVSPGTAATLRAPPVLVELPVARRSRFLDPAYQLAGDVCAAIAARYPQQLATGYDAPTLREQVITQRFAAVTLPAVPPLPAGPPPAPPPARAWPAAPPMLSVMVRVPGDPAVVHHRTGWAVIIGRDPDCDIHIPLVTISRKHARITFDPTVGLTIHDLQSRNGTWLNNVHITRSPLRPGDCLRIGGAEINVSVRR